MSMLKNKWVKITMIAAPMLVAGSVYAFASGEEKVQTAAEMNASGVTHSISEATPLSQAELESLTKNAQPAPVEQPAVTAASTTTAQVTAPDGEVSQSVLDASNPFVVQAPTPAPAQGGTAAPAPAPAQPDPNGKFDLAMVKKLELKSNTTQGALKIEFESEDGKLKLEGEIGGRKIEVEGAMAEQFLTQLMASLNLNQALTAALQGKQVALDAKVLSALEEVKIELKDGKKIESKSKGNPKAEGRHDNGNHYGWDKGKGNKHGDDDDDDDDKGKGKEKDKDKGKKDD